MTAILGGGQGLRLWPLTEPRAKPAVPFGGQFRLIDIPVSNSMHSEIMRIYVITQFNSASLHRHISQTYRFDAFTSGYVNILAAEQRMTSRDWYQGTADAVRQNLYRLCESDPSEVLILSGDQLYLMDLAAFIEQHRERDADLTIAVKAVTQDEARGFGVMRIDQTGRIVEFVEKPQDTETIQRFTLDAGTISRLKLDADEGMVLASMGIYSFRTGLLRQLLEGTTTVDFGNEVIPAAIHEHQVHAFLHNGYWRDIGTIRSFHQANLELTAPVPALNLYDPERPVFTHPRFLPGCKVQSCAVERSIVSQGCIIAKSEISDSIVGVRSRIRPGAKIERSYIMGARVFESERGDRTRVPLGIGQDCEIRNAIIDIDARIGDGVRLVNESNVQEAEGAGYCIRDGIIVVGRGTEIAPGTVV